MDDLQLTSVAALIADPTRAEFLVCMMDGRAFPVSDFATMAHVSLSTASYHLDLLVKAGLVEVEKQGNHRYHRIAGHRVSELIELLGSFRCNGATNAPVSKKQQALTECRVCYSHLAGRVGVNLRRSLEEQGFVIQSAQQFSISEAGLGFFTDLGLDEAMLHTVAVSHTKACLDWTERLPHIGGPLGRALFENFLERKWIVRGEVPRQILVSTIGWERIGELFPSHGPQKMGCDGVR